MCFEYLLCSHNSLNTINVQYCGDGKCPTYDNHLADHEVLVLEGGHGTLVLSAELCGGCEDVEGAVHGRLMTRGAVVQPQSTLEYPQILGPLAGDPLVHRSRTVVEEPLDDKP